VEDKETYAIVMALEKWSAWIGLQPVLVLTDHRTLQSWYKRAMDTPSGMTGRRARWHEKLSRFNLTVVHVKGTDNVVADAMSRWAYPASSGYGDISIHGSAQQDAEVEEILEKEQAEEAMASAVIWLRPVATGAPNHFSFKVRNPPAPEPKPESTLQEEELPPPEPILQPRDLEPRNPAVFPDIVNSSNRSPLPAPYPISTPSSTSDSRAGQAGLPAPSSPPPDSHTPARRPATPWRIKWPA
jgi:hypothetical protein